MASGSRVQLVLQCVSSHDCIPTGPPVSSQPHSLRGEAAQWVDDRLEEECQRGQLVRGSSAWGSAPFPTKEMPSHKRFREQRLVVDYRRVNARVKRSTYYCWRGTDVLAAAAGCGVASIRSATQKGLEKSWPSSPVPVPPCRVDLWPCERPRRFQLRRGSRLRAPQGVAVIRFTKEWIAYVDDLTVRSGRVIDDRFYTDSEADQAIRGACSKGSVATPQAAGAALEALGVRPQGAADKRAKHDSAKADTNHPTRVSVSRGGLGLSGFGWVCGLVGVFLGGPSVWSGRRSWAWRRARIVRTCARVSQVQ